MRYRGFEITSCYDTGIERYDMQESKDVICNGYFCEVYAAEDEQYASRLDSFCLAEGYEISDTTDAALTKGIARYVDDNYFSLLDAKAEIRLKRMEDLVGRMACLLGEHERGEELYKTFSEMLGMTDGEICELGFISLAPYFDRAQYAKTIAEWIIDDGTENTLTGSWTVPYGNIANRFAVDLETDTEMRDMVSRILYDRSDVVADFCMEQDKVTLDFFYVYCPYASKDTPQKQAEQAEKEENELLTAEDAVQTSIYLANAPDCCSGKQQLDNMLGMLGADVSDDDIYHGEDEHPKMMM